MGNACKTGDCAKVAAAIVLGCDVNFRDPEAEPGTTGLMYSSGRTFNFDMMNIILQAEGIHVNKLNKNNWTALHYAASFNNPAAVDLLERVAGLDPNIQDRTKGNTALMYSVWHGYTGCLEQILKIPGVDTNIRNNCGSSALHVAVERGDQECLDSLLDAEGVDINMKNSAGNNVAIICLKINKTKLVSASRLKMFKSILETSRIDLDAKDADNQTLLE